MSKILFIDDEREFVIVIGNRYRQILGLRDFTVEEYTVINNDPQVDIARSYNQAVELFSNNTYDMVFFDHDLGEEKNGMDIAKWVSSNITVPFLFYVHSANPAGRINIMSYIQQYFNHLSAKDCPHA